MTIYGEEGEPERSEDELAELDTMARIITGFVTRRRLIRMMQEFGFTDLDGYLNFRAFSRYIDVENSENRLGGKIAFHIDLHNFTMVNQEVGRANGDIVLKKYYTMIKDAIGDKGIIIRLGGDKFIGVFPEKIKERLFEIFRGEPVGFGDISGRRVVVSAAAGVYVLPPSFVLVSYGEIMDKIIMSSTIAKRKNEGAVVIYDQELENMNKRAKWVQRKFRDALADEEFKAFYQPKVDVNTNEMIGAEALCRWFHEGGIIPPMEFIPILEQGMDICDLDFYMLDRVCKDIHRWIEEGKEVVKVSVNLSRKHLVDVDLLSHIMEIIDRNNTPHEYIEIELTETTTDVQFRDLKRVVTGLHREGVSTAVDDFGIGYSSLNLIREIPWDVLKVDKNFLPLDEEGSGSTTSVMFNHVISMAQDLGMKCVVEGVETEKQIELLKKNKCRIAQGFFFDKPLPVEEFEKRLENKHYT